MAKRLKVAVLMGGKSAEHDISLLSGMEVVKNLNPKKYKVLQVVIRSDGRTWEIGEGNGSFLGSSASKSHVSKINKAENLARFDHEALVSNHGIDVVFIAMHGPFGEDGTIQGLLELMGVHYTGSGVLASALGMDKIYSRKLFTQADLKTPKYVVIKKGEISKIKDLKFPLFVKPNNQGSSVGITRVNKSKDLKKAVTFAHKYSNLALVEEFISGTEITCAIIGNDKPKALPLVEIVPKKEFFDYEAKYNERLCDEIVPARISKTLTKKAQGAALTAYQILGCRGFGRVDMIIKGNNVYILEVNTIPGLTSLSLVPKAARAAGLSYPKLLDKIIAYATP